MDDRQRYRILIVENREDDAELVIEQLTRDGILPEWRRVQTAADLRDALLEPWDIVLSDYVMPGFSGAEALDIVKQSAPDLPFVIISGSVDDRVGVESMKAGAHDFFRKDRLGHLAAAVERAIREAELRRERTQVATALRQVEEQHRLTLESIEDYAIFNLDLDGRVSSWNPGVERVMGYAADAFIGLRLESFVAAEDEAAGITAELLRQARDRGRCEAEGWRLGRDGSRFWAEVTITPLLDATGRLRGYTVVVRDTSERKHLIDELRSAVQVRDEFLSIAAHELRTPLTSLKLHLQSAQRTAAEGASEHPIVASVSTKVEAALRHTNRITGLVETLLDVSRITSGKLEVHRERVDVGELVREVASRLDGIRAASGSALHLNAERPAVGDLDRMRVETMVTNLLTNAFKFGEGKPVDVAVSQEDRTIRIVVRDQGSGISPEDQLRIFQRFERAVPGSQYGGFGIGLWIVRQVAEAHGGRVSVNSAPRAGAQFIVELPVSTTA